MENVEVATWVLFNQLMRATREFFEPGTSRPAAAEPPLTPLLRKCSTIQQERLLSADPALHARMVALGVSPQLYLLRWLRLLFGREFHLEDVMIVWDALFAYGFESLGSHETLSLPLVDDFAIAMVMYVREDLLRLDFSAAMKRLLKFPPVADVHYLVQRALQLRRAHQQRVAANQPQRSRPPPAAAAAATAQPTRALAPPPQPQSAGSSVVANGIGGGGALAMGGSATQARGAVSAAAASERRAVAEAAASATAAAASSSLEDPWNGACNHLRQPPEWPPPQSQAPQALLDAAQQPANANHLPADPFAKPVPFAKLAESHPLGGSAPPLESAAAAAAATAAAAAVPRGPPLWPAPGVAAVVSGGAGSASGTTAIELSARMAASLATLNSALRRPGGEGRETVGCLVGSGAHSELIAAMDELEGVRRALLELGVVPPPPPGVSARERLGLPP